MSNCKPKPRTFCVRFTCITSYRLVLPARSEQDAIIKARRRWHHGDCEAFTPFQSEDHGWDAEEE